MGLKKYVQLFTKIKLMKPMTFKEQIQKLDRIGILVLLWIADYNFQLQSQWQSGRMNFKRTVGDFEWVAWQTW